MTKNEQGSGTIRTVRDRKTGLTLGFQALLPRELSDPPKDCKNPETYQRPIGPRFDTWDEARTLLDAAIVEKRDVSSLRHGLPVSNYVQQEIKGRLNEAKRAYENVARANKSVSTWRSIDRVFISQAPFYGWPPSRVEVGDLQAWFDWLRDEAENSKTGEPLSGSFIRNVAQLLHAAFARAKIAPNPLDSLDLPAKSRPRVVHMALGEQRRFFGSGDIDLEDRVMAGCGMGAAVRVNELLSLEANDIFLDVADPHLIVRYGGDHHAPTKGRRIRRVELFEPGLGFWKIWMARFYTGGVRVFSGPKGGYLKAWPERFPGWSDVVGKKITSHVMRHTYAVAILSGTWAYDPQSLEFVQQQLGHADRATTERYYGAYEIGTWQRQVRRFTGREARPEYSNGLTALELLGFDASTDVSGQENAAVSGSDFDPRYSPKSAQSTAETPQTDASTHQTLRALAELALEVIQAQVDGDPLAAAKAFRLAEAVVLASERSDAEAEIQLGRIVGGAS